MISKLFTLLGIFIFFISGFSALIYQVAWQRILTLHSGIGIYSISIIVAAFMAGLAIGSHFAGVVSKKISRRKALFFFGLIEFLIGIFAFSSCWIYYNILYLKTPYLYLNLFTSAITHLFALIIPTMLMGMSLPFLVKAVVSNSEKAFSIISILYSINTLGAAFGALAAPWFFIRHFGISGAIAIGGCLNVVTGTSVLLIYFAARKHFQAENEKVISSDRKQKFSGQLNPDEKKVLKQWIFLYTLSGFSALSLEILWFRILDVGVKSTAFTFGSMLSIYLLGLGIGSLVGVKYASKRKTPLVSFLIIQCAILIYTALSIILLTRVSGDFFLFKWLKTYWSGAFIFKLGQDWNLASILNLYVLLPVFLYLVPTLLMGISFPLLQKAVQNDAQTSSYKVGILQSSNIMGCMLGSLVTGLLFLTIIGSAGTIVFLIIAIGASFIFIGLKQKEFRKHFAALILVFIILIVLMPSNHTLWKTMLGIDDEKYYICEDSTGVVSWRYLKKSWILYINGKSQSALPFGNKSSIIHTQLGSIPSIVHKDPKAIAIIGLGSGDTAWASGCRRNTKIINVYELFPTEMVLLKTIDGITNYKKLKTFLNDDRYKHINEDGRTSILKNDIYYDIIEADPLRPHTSYSGNIFSVEFFTLCSNKLKNEGIMCTWSPTPRVMKSFCSVFPYVYSFVGNRVLIGSKQPLNLDQGILIQRIKDNEVYDYLGTQLAERLITSLQDMKKVQEITNISQEKYLNRDLFPRDEYATPDIK